jgi:hypothetical protein
MGDAALADFASLLYQIEARIAFWEKEEVEKLARAALQLQPDLTTKYVREQEWYRDDAALEKLIERLVDAGISKQVERAP